MISTQQLNQSQFGRSAADYVTSTVHAKGWTLQRMLDMVQPQPEWHMLDIATGGGHTALIFAPHVASVVASDLTVEMLEAAGSFIREQGVENVTTKQADAVALPFDDNQFDLVTCRIAPHHFPDVFKFLQECQRILKPTGTLAIVDNTVPEGKGGDYVNAFERLRDPSHVRCLSTNEWESELFAAGFNLTAKEEGRMAINFDKWTARMRVSADDRTRLKVLLKQAPPTAAAALDPQFEGDRITFYLQRIILIAQPRQ